MDSFTLLHHVLRLRGRRSSHDRLSLRQRHRRELDVAAKVCDFLGIERIVVNLTSLGPLFRKRIDQSRHADAGRPLRSGQHVTDRRAWRNTIIAVNRNGVAESALGEDDVRTCTTGRTAAIITSTPTAAEVL